MTYRPLLVALGFFVMASACGGSKTPAPSGAPAGPPLAVAIARAEPVDVPVVFDAGGIVRASLTATISSRVLASVTAVRVRPGDRVQRGQVLVELDARELDANHTRASATLGAADDSVRAGEADVRAAEAVLMQARSSRDRVVTLFDKRSATAQERDDAHAVFAAADARLAGARARLASATSAAAADRAAVEAAGIAASYATLLSPFDGVVAARRADPGDVAMPGAPLLVIEQTGVQHLEVTIDEARAARIALSQPVRVHLDQTADADGNSRSIDGRVVEIARLDAESHSFVVKIELPATAGTRTGAYGRAEFDGPTHRALVVPASAMVRRGQLAFVFTVDAGQARLRQVSPGPTTSAGSEVTAGLSSGDMVIVSPAAALADGARVSTAGGR